MAAGIQPISVNCKIKQIIPANGRLMVKNANQGKINAINSLMTKSPIVPFWW